jgi:putative ABC transport system permease protein
MMTIDNLAPDLRLSWRALRRTPGFTLVAITTLALGLWLTTTTIAVVNAYLIRGLPYPAANHLYHVIYAPVGQPEPRGVATLDWMRRRLFKTGRWNPFASFA